MTRQIILDTETTGLSAAQGHRLIEIGCIEMINRKITDHYFHRYINPKRMIDAGATKIHGITEKFLADKPAFEVIAEDLFQYLTGAELIIHNAPFDLSFLDAEFSRINAKHISITQHCSVIDTLIMARKEHPGQQNNLDALCRRYKIDNKHRDFHGALKDAELLSQIYLLMTGGQSQLFSSDNHEIIDEKQNNLSVHTEAIIQKRRLLKVTKATESELKAHEAFFQA